MRSLKALARALCIGLFLVTLSISAKAGGSGEESGGGGHGGGGPKTGRSSVLIRN